MPQTRLDHIATKVILSVCASDLTDWPVSDRVNRSRFDVDARCSQFAIDDCCCFACWSANLGTNAAIICHAKNGRDD